MCLFFLRQRCTVPCVIIFLTGLLSEYPTVVSLVRKLMPEKKYFQE